MKKTATKQRPSGPYPWGDENHPANRKPGNDRSRSKPPVYDASKKRPAKKKIAAKKTRSK